MSDTLDRLCQIVRDRALRFGEFTLASGKTSSYYLDGKQVTLHGAGLRLIAEAILEVTEDLEFDAIGGLVIGADPIVGGVLTVAAERGRTLDGFLVRKEAKGHGTKKYVEGPIRAGSSVLVVEDVVTTGASAVAAVDRVEEFGASVVGVTAIVDRLEGGGAAFAGRGLTFRPLLTIADFGIDPPGDQVS